MFWVTLAAALGAVVSAGVGFLLYRANVDPHVIVYATVDRKRPSLILLVIENIGRGVARNVSFESDRPVPWRAFGIEKPDRPVQAMEGGPLITGIPSLAPGGQRVLAWGQYGGLLAGLGERAIHVTATYEPDSSHFLSATPFITDSVLEIKSFEFTDAAEDPQKASADQLKKIADALSQIGSGFRKIRVEVTPAKTEGE